MSKDEKSVICEVSIDNINFKESLEFVEELIYSRKSTFIVTPNIDHIIKLQTDVEFQKIYREAAWVQ